MHKFNVIAVLIGFYLVSLLVIALFQSRCFRGSEGIFPPPWIFKVQKREHKEKYVNNLLLKYPPPDLKTSRRLCIGCIEAINAFKSSIGFQNWSLGFLFHIGIDFFMKDNSYLVLYEFSRASFILRLKNLFRIFTWNRWSQKNYRISPSETISPQYVDLTNAFHKAL